MGALLIGDVGGSSSRWALVEGLHTTLLHEDGPWPGWNAATGDGAALMGRLHEAASRLAGVDRVLVHAAGCGTAARAQRLATALAPLLPQAEIAVEDDLLGAARAVWGNTPGLALIAGTGMNAGRYDGGRLCAGIPSLGYILGDEGSGADIGRALLRDALRERMPPQVCEAVFGSVPVLAEVVEQLYRRGGGAAFLAGPVARLAAVRDEPYVRALLGERFDALAAEVGRVLGEGELRAVGSVAAGFREELAAALQRHGLVLTRAVADPLPGLITYARQAWPR